MTRWMRLAVLALTLLLGMVSCESDNDSDVDDIAASLADELTAALQFDNGAVVEGAAPQAQTAADAPEIAEVQSDELRLGAPFSMQIGTEFASPDDIAKVLVVVKGASKYIEVTASFVSGIVDLFGQLAAKESLKGEAFTLQFALQTAAGVTGPYKDFALTVSEEEPQTSVASGDELLSELGATDEFPVKSGRPAGQAGSEAPQIVNIESHEEVYPEDYFYASLNTDFADEAGITAILISTPNSASYFEFPAMVSGGWGSFHSLLRGGNLQAGDRFVLLFAFKAGDAVGLYRAHTFTVGTKSSETDGDYTDGDSEVVTNHCPTPQDIVMYGDSMWQAYIIFDHTGRACSYSSAYSPTVTAVFDCMVTETESVFTGGFSVETPWTVASMSAGTPWENAGGDFTVEQTNPDFNIDITITDGEGNYIDMTVAFDCPGKILHLNGVEFR